MKLNKNIKVLAIGLTVALTIGSMVGCSSNNESSNAENGYSEIDSAKTEELVGNQEKTLVIDLRDYDKYNSGHLENAINIPFDEFESKIDELKGYENQDIILICNTGNKSGKASEMLVDRGFKKVYNAQDGMDEYDYTKVTYENITGEEFEKMVKEEKGSIIVDVRDKKDYDKSRVENAINIPIDQFEQKYKELDKDKDILIYCSIGRRSAQAANILKENGYEKVYNAVDGVNEYEFKLVE